MLWWPQIQEVADAVGEVHVLRRHRVVHPSRAVVHSAGLLQHLTARGQTQSLPSEAALQLATCGTLSFPCVSESPSESACLAAFFYSVVSWP